ncbi:hypothetical protein V3481_017356 [Fusarium oxysporum f. sp. vasinfectum]
MGPGSTLCEPISYGSTDTPFISFFNSWEKAKRKRKQILRMGARNVIIIAVWLKNKPFVYSAYDFAIDHGFPDDQVRCHEGEYLVYGGIPAEEYRILACFRGDNLLDEELDLTPFVSAPWKYRVSIPAGSLPIPANTSGAEALKMELYSLTGVLNDLKFFLLVLSLSGYSSSTTVEQPGGLVRVEEYLPPLSCTHLFEE